MPLHQVIMETFFRNSSCNESSLAYLFVFVIVIDLKTYKLAFLIEYTDILSC